MSKKLQISEQTLLSDSGHHTCTRAKFQGISGRRTTLRIVTLLLGSIYSIHLITE